MIIIIDSKKAKDSFVSLFQNLRHNSASISMKLTLSGLHIQCMDKSTICLADLKLDASWFNSYDLEGDEPLNLCVDSALFYSIISIKSEDQQLIIKKQETNDYLEIEFNNLINNSDYNKYFKLNLIDNEYEEMLFPDVDYDAEFSIQTKNIIQMFNQLNNFGNILKIKCNEETINLITEDNNTFMKININCDDLNGYSITEGEDLELNYNLNYINKMCMLNKLTEVVEFSLSKEYPLKISYDLGTSSQLLFYLASTANS